MKLASFAIQNLLSIVILVIELSISTIFVTNIVIRTPGSNGKASQFKFLLNNHPIMIRNHQGMLDEKET
jgi:hypothetical protein